MNFGYINEIANSMRLHGVSQEIQLIKLTEEVGEAAEAFIGQLGLNPRKGFSHSKEDFIMELADVVVTAMVGIEMAGADPETIIDKKLDYIKARYMKVGR